MILFLEEKESNDDVVSRFPCFFRLHFFFSREPHRFLSMCHFEIKQRHLSRLIGNNSHFKERCVH